MTESRRAIFLAYVNARVLEHAIETANPEMRVSALEAAQTWLDSVKKSNRGSHPSSAILQGYIFYADRSFAKAVDILQSLSDNSHYWPLALRLICCCSSNNSLPRLDLQKYYSELIQSDFFEPVLLLSFPGDEREIDALAKMNCAIALGNRNKNPPAKYPATWRKKVLEILDTIHEKYRGSEYHAVLGQQLIDLQQLDKAEVALDKSRAIAENTPALVGLSRIYRLRGDFQKSLHFANSALELSPQHLSARASKGVTLYHMKEYSEAIPILASVVLEEPFYIEMIDALGRSIVASGEELVNLASLLRTGKTPNQEKAHDATKILGRSIRNVLEALSESSSN